MVMLLAMLAFIALWDVEEKPIKGRNPDIATDGRGGDSRRGGRRRFSGTSEGISLSWCFGEGGELGDGGAPAVVEAHVFMLSSVCGVFVQNAR